MRTLLRCVVVVAGASILALGLGKPAEAVHGHTYEVTVHSSFGTTFTDCYRFEAEPGMDFIVDLLFGQVLTFAHDRLNSPHEKRWQSTPRIETAEGGLGIAFHGEAINHLTAIRGNAVNETGDTFVFRGFENPDCFVGVGAQTAGGTPYHR